MVVSLDVDPALIRWVKGFNPPHDYSYIFFIFF